MYEDKLDGKIDEEFWTRKMNDWSFCESWQISFLPRCVGVAAAG